jgi:MtN3 and saliva related transmembrane protein
MWVEFVGFLAGILTTVSFIPQVMHVVRTKSVQDISPLMYSLFCVGVLFWFIYGILLGALAAIVANSITLVLSAIILFYTIKYRK